jgi:ferredoxin
MPHVTIDREGCISCGTCYLECPDLFEENPEDAKSQIVERFRIRNSRAEGIVPEDLAGCAQTAADECPAAVITVE